MNKKIVHDALILTAFTLALGLILGVVYEITKDLLAIGIDPEKVHFFIQSKIPEIAELTVFYSNLVVSLLLLGILCAGSNFIAVFFHQPVLGRTLSVMSIVLLINALSLVHKTILIKKIDFKSQAIFSLVSSLLSGIVGISMAYSGMGIWSLVGQQLSRQVLLTISFWIVGKWVPKMMFSVACFKELYNFGLKLLAANLINFLISYLFKDYKIAIKFQS